MPRGSGRRRLTARRTDTDDSTLLGLDSRFRREFGSIAGIDEAGRGPLAGPLVSCGVILPPGMDLPGVTDSKALTDGRRRKLFDDIVSVATGFSTGEVSSGEIDSMGMSVSVRTSFRRAAENLQPPADMFLIDGNPVRDLGFPCRFLVKGDSRSLSIAAASIIAKVTRDDIMLRWHDTYPLYDFHRNKGYGTPGHLRALADHGPSPIHRMSFSPLRETATEGQLALPLGDDRDIPATWRRAEAFVAAELESRGWELRARNHSWRGGEVDIVVCRGDTAAFVEVKYFSRGMREHQLEKLAERGSGGMFSAAADWLKKNDFTGPCRFDLALVGEGEAGFEMEYIEHAFDCTEDFLI